MFSLSVELQQPSQSLAKAAAKEIPQKGGQQREGGQK